MFSVPFFCHMPFTANFVENVVTVENIPPPPKLYPWYVLAPNYMPNYIPFMDDWCVEM